MSALDWVQRTVEASAAETALTSARKSVVRMVAASEAETAEAMVSSLAASTEMESAADSGGSLERPFLLLAERLRLDWGSG